MRAQLEKMGTEVIASTPAQFSEQIAADTKKWAKIVKERNIKAD
jgi:tripartite-type tricarboxylate transporter receptor subunit TctC